MRKPITEAKKVSLPTVSAPMEYDKVKRNREGSYEGKASKASKTENEEILDKHQDVGIQNVEPEESVVEDEELDGTTIIMELGEKEIKDKLITCRATFLKILRLSPFEGKHSGMPLLQHTKHRVILNIMKKSDVIPLLEINKLTFEDETWPINWVIMVFLI